MTDNGISEFNALREALKTEANWRSPGPLRDAAAFAGLAVQGDAADVARRLRATADEIKAGHRRSALARNGTRYALAADLLARGRDVASFFATIESGKKAWRASDLRRGGFYTDYALMLMASVSDGAPIEGTRIGALRTVYTDVKEANFWHVGPYTLPAAAIAATLLGPDAGRRALAAYDRIVDRVPRLKNRAIAASLIAICGGEDPEREGERFAEVYSAVREYQRQPARATQIAALASLSDRPADEIAMSAERYGDALNALRPRVRFNRKLGLAFAAREALQATLDKGAETRVSALILAAQSFLTLQSEQAATIAATTAAVGAAAGSS
ncbi:MAG: hypothetical protein AAFR11_14945 [Pseudomonadota bacterium]